MTDNQNSLAEYVQTGSDAAFRELVSRYVDLVYSTALRLVGGDAHRAEDVAQTVFANLARVARTLPKDVKLGGWLHRDTCFTASTLMRGERRRQAREKEAAEMKALQNTSGADYSLVAPVLDEAINELGDEDRTAILLRFYEQNDFRSVGNAIGSTEDAARMRVTRALEKLEGFLKRRGVTTTVASLSVALSANAVQAAPVGLTVTIFSTAAALTGTALATPATATITKAIAMTAFQKTIIAAVVVASVAIPPAIQHQNQKQLRRENESLRLQIEQQEQLAAENERLSNELARTRNTSSLSTSQLEDLLRLRAEVTRLKADSLEQQARVNTAREQNSNDPVTAEMRSWLGRVNQLKQRMDQVAGQKVPEMQMLTQNDWLSAARSPLETEDDFRRAMSSLRARAARVAADALAPALKQYLNEHNSEFPTDVAQLLPYFNPPINPEALQNFAIKPASAMPRSNLGGDWIIMTKEPVDLEHDIASGIGPNGSSAATFKAIRTLLEREELNAALKALDSAKIAFIAANSGNQPTDPLQLEPYVRTAEEQTAFEKIRAFQEAKEKAAREKFAR